MHLALTGPAFRSRIHVIVVSVRGGLGVSCDEAKVLERTLEGRTQSRYAGSDEANETLDDRPHTDFDGLAGLVVSAAETGRGHELDDRGSTSEHTQAHENADNDTLAEGALDLTEERDGENGEDEISGDVDARNDDGILSDGLLGPAFCGDDAQEVPGGVERDALQGLGESVVNGKNHQESDVSIEKAAHVDVGLEAEQHEGDGGFDGGHAPGPERLGDDGVHV